MINLLAINGSTLIELDLLRKMSSRLGVTRPMTAFTWYVH